MKGQTLINAVHQVFDHDRTEEELLLNELPFCTVCGVRRTDETVCEECRKDEQLWMDAIERTHPDDL